MSNNDLQELDNLSISSLNDIRSEIDIKSILISDLLNFEIGNLQKIFTTIIGLVCPTLPLVMLFRRDLLEQFDMFYIILIIVSINIIVFMGLFVSNVFIVNNKAEYSALKIFVRSKLNELNLLKVEFKQSKGKVISRKKVSKLRKNYNTLSNKLNSYKEYFNNYDEKKEIKKTYFFIIVLNCSIAITLILNKALGYFIGNSNFKNALLIVLGVYSIVGLRVIFFIIKFYSIKVLYFIVYFLEERQKKKNSLNNVNN